MAATTKGILAAISLAGICSLAQAGNATSLAARQDFRKAVAAGGAAADKAIANGLDAPDPAIRRAALWELYAKNPAAALDRLDLACRDASREVSALAAELARAIPDEARRRSLLERIATRGTTPEARRIAASAIPFPFHRDDVPLSQNPTYDHELVKVWTRDLPQDGWKFRADTSASGHLGESPFFGTDVDLSTDDWKDISIGRHWESFRAVGKYDGIGWCVFEFALPERVEGLSYELCFDAVDEEAWVWLNGTYVGQHAEGVDGWNKPFRMDVGKELVWGGKNRLAVRVNDTFAGGGIYKGVRLEVLK